MNLLPPLKKLLGILIISVIPVLGFSQNINVLQNLAKQVQSGQISQEEAIKKARKAGVSIQDFEQIRQKTSDSQIKQVSDTDKAAAPSQKQPRDTVETKKSREKEKQDSIRKEYFGYDLFKGPRDKFDKVDIGKIDPNYQVGPGDEIILSIWGEAEMRSKYEVARDGTIFIERYGQMVIGGLTLKQLEEKLTRNLSKIYSGLSPSRGNPSTFLDVSLGELQSIQVYVIGKVENPGSRFVSSYSTAFSALYQSGGPTLKGSLRDISVIRDGETVSSLDLYTFITSGKKPNDIRLQNNDVIYVPPRLSTVRLKGEVKQKAFYELKENETLTDLIEFSGGLKTTADEQKLQVERVAPFDERKKGSEIYTVMTPGLRLMKEDGFTVNPLPMEDGDIVSILPLTGESAKDTIPGGVDYVNVSGHVYKPGKYVLGEDMTVMDLLNKAGGLKDSVFWGETFQIRADLIRYKKNYLDREIIPIPLDELIAGNEEANLGLKNRDSIIVYNADVIHKEKQVRIYGEVSKPGSYILETNMGLQDLLLQAGGFTKRAYKYNIEVFRLREEIKNGELARFYNVEISPDMLRDFDVEDGFQLKDYDMIVVRKDPDFEEHRIVSIAGQVKFPGKYPILHKNETFGSLIERAGGLTDEAFLPGLKFTRDDSLKIVGDFDQIIQKGRKGIVLHEDDSVYIPQHPGTVKVSGSVRNPGLVQYHEKWSLERYVEAAGDYTFEAAKSKTVVYYPGGNARRKNFLWDPKIKEGSEIFVPQKPEREPVDITQLLTNWASIATSVATVIYIIGRTN